MKINYMIRDAEYIKSLRYLKMNLNNYQKYYF